MSITISISPNCGRIDQQMRLSSRDKRMNAYLNLNNYPKIKIIRMLLLAKLNCTFKQVRVQLAINSSKHPRNHRKMSLKEEMVICQALGLKN